MARVTSDRGSRTALAATAVMAAVATSAVVAPGPAYADESATANLIFKDSSTDRTPAKTAIPNYPRIARRDRIEGDATVCFRIDLNGRIRSARIENYSHKIFRRPSLKAIRDSSFEPLRPHQILSKTRTCRTYRFRLEPVLAENLSDKKSDNP